MQHKDTYKLFMKSVYQTSSDNAQYIYEYILLRGIELVSLLSEKKLPPEKLKAYTEYEISYDSRMLFATIKMILETCVPKEIVRRMTDYHDILKYLNNVRVYDNNKFYVLYFQSRFFKSLATLNLCEDFEKAHRGRFPDAEDIRIAEGGVVDYDSSIYNLYVNAMKKSVASSDFFIKINRGHKIYDKIRCIDLKLPDNKKKDKNPAEILSIQMYEKLTCEVLDFMCKYDYKYSEIICLLCLNFRLPDKVVHKASFREKLMGVKIEPFDKMPYMDAYSVFMSLSPEMSKKESENFVAYYADIKKIISERVITKDYNVNPKLAEKSDIFTSFYADKKNAKFIPEKREANVVTSNGGFVSGYSEVKKGEKSLTEPIDPRVNLNKSGSKEEKKEEGYTESVFKDNYASEEVPEEDVYYEDDRNWFVRGVDFVKNWFADKFR